MIKMCTIKSIVSQFSISRADLRLLHRSYRGVELENVKSTSTANGDSSVLLLCLWEKEGMSQSGISFFLYWALNPDSTVPNCLCAPLITDAGAFAEKDEAQRAALLGIKRGGDHLVASNILCCTYSICYRCLN